MDQFLGQLLLWAGTYAPKGWAFCNGQTMSIAQNQALFSLLGTTYGGDGITTFALPDLQGRVPVHSNNGVPGPGLTPVTLGEVYGFQNISLTIANLAPHNHLPVGTPVTVGIPVTSADDNDVPNPVGGYLNGTDTNNYSGTANAAMGQIDATVSVQNAGQSMPVSTVGPSLGMNYCIALMGIYPSRN